MKNPALEKIVSKIWKNYIYYDKELIDDSSFAWFRELCRIANIDNNNKLTNYSIAYFYEYDNQVYITEIVKER